MRFHWTELSALGFNYCRDELPAPNEWPSSYLLNPASARLGVIVESPFDVSTDTLLFLTCEFERLLCFLGSREGSVGQLQPTGSIGRKFLFFLFASGLRHLEHGQGGGISP